MSIWFGTHSPTSYDDGLLSCSCHSISAARRSIEWYSGYLHPCIDDERAAASGCVLLCKVETPHGEAFETRQHQKADDMLFNAEVVRLILSVCQQVLYSETWKHAFLGCGFGDNQKHVKAAVQRNMNIVPSDLNIDVELPSLSQLQCVMPARRKIPVGWLFHLYTSDRTEPMSEPEQHLPQSPWLGRLRSSSQAAIFHREA